MKPSLRVPKYNACVVRMQRQLAESQELTMMSMNMSIDSDEDSKEHHGADDFGEVSADDGVIEIGIAEQDSLHDGKDERKNARDNKITKH